MPEQVREDWLAEAEFEERRGNVLAAQAIREAADAVWPE